MNEYFVPIKKELIFAEGTAPFKSCHASNLCALSDGSLRAVWFGGEKESDNDVAIWSSRRVDGNWSAPELLAKDKEEPHWNPVLYEREDGKVLLYYKVGMPIAQWYTMVKEAADAASPFGESRELVPGDRGGRGPVRCKMTRLSDGSLLAGASTEEGIWTAFADRSEDDGYTFTSSNRLHPFTKEVAEGATDKDFAKRGVIQPTFWESAPGAVHMLLRSSEGYVYRADSGDYGRTWCEIYPTELPNNNSGIDVAKCDDGLLVLCMNPVGQDWGARTPIVLMVSRDNGATWQEEHVLEDAKGEFSYPSVVVKGDRLYVTYTHDRKSIAFAELKRK